MTKCVDNTNDAGNTAGSGEPEQRKRWKPSEVIVQCDRKMREEIREAFREIYLVELKKKLEKLKTDFRKFHATQEEFNFTVDWNDETSYYGVFEANGGPFRFANSTKGFKILADCLTINLIHECGNDTYYLGYGEEAFVDALKKLKDKYPDIHYEGTVHYMASDNHSGEKVKFTVSD